MISVQVGDGRGNVFEMYPIMTVDDQVLAGRQLTRIYGKLRTITFPVHDRSTLDTDFELLRMKNGVLRFTDFMRMAENIQKSVEEWAQVLFLDAKEMKARKITSEEVSTVNAMRRKIIVTLDWLRSLDER